MNYPGIINWFILVLCSGVFYFNTTAQSWEKINLPLYSSTPFTYLVTSNGTEFIGTEGTLSGEMKDGAIFRSEDGGLTWQLKNRGINSYRITCLAEAPNGWLYAGTQYGGVGGVIGCLFRSKDNGESWQLMINNDPVMYTIKFNSLGHIFAGSENGLYVSTNNGSTWTLRKNGLRNTNILSLLLDNDSTMFAATNDGIHYSTDYGLTWTPKNTGFIPWAGYYQTNKLQRMNDTLFVSCINGLFFSADSGNTWHQRAALQWVSDLQIDDNGVFYLNYNNHDLMISYNRGATWATRYSFSTYVFYYTIRGNKIFASQSETGFYISTDGGSTFTQYFSEPYLPVEISKLKIYNGIWYLGSLEKGLFISEDSGISWRSSGPANQDIVDIEFKANGELFVISGRQLYTSRNQGLNWMYIPPPGPVMDILQIHTSPSDQIFGAYRNNTKLHLVRLNELGSWDSLIVYNDGIFGTQVTDMIVDRYNDAYLSIYKTNGFDSYSYTCRVTDNFNSTVYLLNKLSMLAYNDSGHVFFAYQNHLLRTRDRGVVLEEAVTGISFYPSSIKITTDNEFYLGCINKALISYDGGYTWGIKEYPQSDAGNTSIEKSGGYIVVATRYWIYKHPAPLLPVIENPGMNLPGDFFLAQNFPNPFNTETKIRYSVPSDCFVRIGIYDALGREITTLINEHKLHGNYEVSWNASDYPSAVYFLNMKAGKFIQTRKIILLK